VSLASTLKSLVALAPNLSLRELARIADVSDAYPSLIASGERERIGTDVAQKLAAVLGTTIDYLVSGNGRPPSKARVGAAVTAAREAFAITEAAKEEAKRKAAAAEEPAPDSSSAPTVEGSKAS
jgi:transcriptional regulator with XRE-family HTH domain